MSRVLKTMIVLLAIAALATPVLAADDYKFSVYGSARMTTFYDDYDQADDQDLTFDLQSNSRFGMKASKGAVSGQYEVGTSGSVRVIKGVYAFDGGKLTIGQTYTPYTFFSEQVHNADQDFIGYGATYEGRKPLIAVEFDNGFGLWAIKNEGMDSDVSDNDTDADLPKLAISYKGKAGNFSYGANAAYQTYTDAPDTAAEFDVDSYLLTFNGVVDLNPAAISFNLAYGQNAAEFGLGDGLYGDRERSIDGVEGEHVAATEDEDTDFMAGFVQLAFKADDSNTIRLGVGYVEEDNDDYAQTEKRMSYFIHDQYTIAPGFFVVPEISFYDGMDDADGSDGEESMHIGAKWQINF